MPKATLEFNLPEETSEFTLATRGGELHGILWELDQKLRSIVKYDNLEPRMIDLVEGETLNEDHKTGAICFADWLRTYIRELGYDENLVP